jgi:hypothetical protein
MYHPFLLFLLPERPERFNGLLQRLWFLEANELLSPDLNSANQLLAKLSANIHRVLGFQYQLDKRHIIGMLVDIPSCKPAPCFHSGFSRSACWVPFDIYMENTMDGKQLPIKSAVDVLTGYSLEEYTLNLFLFNFCYLCVCVCE